MNRASVLLLCFFSTWLFAATALAGPPARGLLAARAGFVTQAAPSTYQAGGPAKAGGAPFELTRYRSPAGDLVAYRSRDPGDGKKHPAVLWAHGGFGGVGVDDLAQVVPLVEAGLVVMCPSWRGENDNKGRYEMFYGEVDDALAALDHLAALPYVDPDRLYVAGHSTGGTIALLVAESTDRARAVFSLGGAPDVERFVAAGGAPQATPPFPVERAREAELRSPIRFVAEIRTPTFYFEGARGSAYTTEAEKMAALAKEKGAPFTARAIAGGDHFTIVKPLLTLIGQKIAAGDPAISGDEAQAAFAASLPLVKVEDRPTGFTMGLRTDAPICTIIPVTDDDAPACAGFDVVGLREEVQRNPAKVVHLRLLRFDGWAATVTLVTDNHLLDPARADSRAGLVRGMREVLPPNARLRGVEPGSDSTLVQIDGRPALQVLMELPTATGAAAGVFYVVQGDGASLNIQFHAPATHAAELERFAAASIATVHLKGTLPRVPPPPAAPASRVGGTVGVLVVAFLLMAAGVGASLLLPRSAPAKRR